MSGAVGGKGGYSIGILNILKKTIIYLYAGGKGGCISKSANDYTGGFNGGGTGGISGSMSRSGGGGGASDIRINQDSLYARIIVAGGGGATSWGPTSETGDAGGGTSSAAGTNSPGLSTQNSGNTFGIGGNCYTSSSSYNINGAGGGGWYGGKVSTSSYASGSKRHGGGGSGYVYTSSTASSYPSGCLLNSSYYLTEAQTIAGNTSFISPTGTAETGHAGNGYVRITVIEIKSNNISIYSKNLNPLPSGYIELEYIQTTGTQYINTEVIPNDNIGFDATLEVLTPLTSSPYYNLFGARGNDASGGSAETQNTFRIDTIPIDNNTGTELKFGTTIYNSGITGSQKIHIELKNKVYTKPDGSKIQLSGTITNTYPIYIGCLNKENNPYGNKPTMKIYNFKLYNGDNLIRNFIPALRNSDKKTGLYDIVNNKFYTDAGGSNFTCNNVKDPQCITYLNGEYLNDQSNNAISVQNNGITLSEEQKFNEKSTLKCSGSAYMYIPFPTSQIGDITIECWIYQTSNTNSTYPTPYTLISSGGRGLYLHQNNNQTYCATSSSGQQMTATATKPVLNKWVHLVQCLSGTTTYCFVDGTLIGTIANTNTTYVGLTIGTLSESVSSLYSTSCYWQGYIGEVKVSKGCKYLTNYTEQANPYKDYSWKSNSAFLFKKTNWINYKDIYIKFNPQSLLPSGYTALEYIKCEGAQYINTQFIPTGNTRVLLDFETDTSESQNLFCGGRTAASGSDKQTFTAFYSVNNEKTIRRDYYGTSKTSTITYNPGRILFDANKNKTYINKNLDSVLSNYTLATSTASVMPIVLFTTCHQTSSSAALTLSNSNWAKYKVYSCKIWDNDIIQRNLIPAKNTSGTLGLYDAVNNMFYTNAGTGTFTAGPIATTSWVKIGSL